MDLTLGILPSRVISRRPEELKRKTRKGQIKGGKSVGLMTMAKISLMFMSLREACLKMESMEE
ncbi:hypothetical protein Tsubulata_024995 [Turnera subulata]|uniref:Uncharacterized protein n=1 Tax=Turnera subulata TaxID=218843 RepID=A0A9Q0JBZ1_9ROSI|nr:hypothetical protein Tsubulata_024995 [Turnera subulata]